MTVPSQTSQLSAVLWPKVFNSQWVKLVGLLIVIGSLTLTAIHPLLFGAMPRTDDGMMHLYRLISLDHSIRHGQLWPRYVASMAFGYGAPSFNFYSPLSLYLFEAIHLLGLPFLNAFLVGLILYTLVGVLGAYALGTVWGGKLTGLGMAVAYTYAPYTIYNMLHRGAVAEFAALAVLPWAMWAFHRLALYERRRDFILAVVLFSVIILIHNITALTSTLVLATYSLYLWWVGRNPPRLFVQFIGVGVLAVGLTSFFWLPALAEGRYVHLERMNTGVSSTPDDPIFYVHFQTVDQTLAMPETADLTRFNAPIQRTLGWPQIILGLAGIGLTFWKSQRDEALSRTRIWLIAATILIAILVFLVTQSSAWFWIHVPLMRYFQFPWRCLGPASLLLAMLAGIGMAAVARRIPWQVGRVAWVSLCLAGMVVYAMPWLYRQYLPKPAATSILDAQDYERRTGVVAGGAYGEYLPIWVRQEPDPNRLTGLYAQSEVIPRLQPMPGVTVQQAAWGITQAKLAFTSDEDTTLTFDWLYFPGWWAELDGEQATLFPTEPSGFVGLSVPAGKHSLALGFGPTPVRLGAMIASAVFAALLVALVLFRGRLWWTKPSGEVGTIGAQHATPLQPTGWIMVAAGLIGILAFAGKALLVDNLQTPIKSARFAGGIEAGLQIPFYANFGRQIDLLGYDLSSPRIASGQSSHLTLYWQPSGGLIAEDYSSVVYLRDAGGNVVAQFGSIYPGGWPTSSWVPGFYVLENLDLTVPSGTPPGSYTIDLSLYWFKGGRSLDIVNAQGNPLGVTVQIGMLEVTRPFHPAKPDELGAEAQRTVPLQNIPMTDGITLLAASQPPLALEVGQPFVLMLDWQAQSQPTQAYILRVLWLVNRQVAATSPPLSPVTAYPTDQWRPGDVWKGIHLVHVPGRLEAGDYEVAVQLFDPDGNAIGSYGSIGEMTVSTPPRTFNAPRMGVTADTAWENGIHLLGYDLPDLAVRQGDGLNLTLYWQTDSDLATSLTVFVHVYDADGRIVAQQDSIPVSGARPTTGWAPGEIVTDSYAIFIPPDVPPGRYWIRIGLYDATGERMRLLDGSNLWILPQSIRVIAGP